MDLRQAVEVYIGESLRVTANLSREQIYSFVNEIIEAYKNKSKIFACGNGGNAAVVANLITDLNIHPFVSKDKSKLAITRNHGFSCFDLCSHPATITGVLNDFGSDFIFLEQLRHYASAGDLLIAFSGSGNSKNIIKALEFANEIGMRSIVVTKNNNANSVNLADISVIIPGDSQFPGQTDSNNNNFHFEDMLSKLSHIAVGMLWDYVRK